MAPDIALPAGALDVLLQSGGEDMSRIDVFEQIYLVFLVLGTLVGAVVIAYTLYKVYKYRAGADHDYDVGRPQLGELPTGADKGGRKLFLSFTISALIVVSLIAWTYGLLLYVETGSAEVPEDGVEIEVTGDNFAWEFEYQDDQRLPQDQVDEAVEVMGQQATADALRAARDNGSLSYSAALADGMDAESEDDVAPSDIDENVGSIGSVNVPVGREVHIDTTSGDVWHTFGIPELRVKSDAIPGEVSETWFVAEEAGDYDANCYELCGSGHSGMSATVTAMPSAQFDSWYAGETVVVDEAIEELSAGEYSVGGEETSAAIERNGGNGDEGEPGASGGTGASESAGAGGSSPAAGVVTGAPATSGGVGA